MGIFEKAIPKYIHNHDYRNEVEVVPAPENVYVDDIFDPILNANVRNAMRQKYGGGLYGIAGGYSELFKNIWTGNEGIFGKGMGILSTFGRSMDKAGDFILGTLTEGVEGVTGQGFDNPLRNIFVEDEDYSGRRLLAAAANSMRGLAGGTTVTEKDFGSAWTLPATGIELMTDPGIMGGGLARTFTPGAFTKGANKLSSKQLLKQIASSDLKTAVGSVGQLLDRYDDLMAKVAMDVTAPGLRPAIRGLKNQLAKLIPTRSAEDMKDYAFKKRRSNPDGTPTGGSDDSKAIAGLIDNLTEAESRIPVSPEEAEYLANRTTSQIMQDVVDNGPMNNYKYTTRWFATPDDIKVPELRPAETFSYDDAVNEDALVGFKGVRDGMRSFNEGLGEALEKSLKRAEERGYPLHQLGVSGRYDIDFTPDDLNSVREIIKREALGDYGTNFKQDFFKGFTEDDLAYMRWTDRKFEEARTQGIAPTDDLFAPNKVQDELEYAKNLEAAKLAGKEKEFLAGKWPPESSFSLGHAAEKNPAIDKRYVDEIRSLIDDDEALTEALLTRRFSDHDATNNTLLKILGDRRWEASPFYKKFSRKFNLKPSRMAKLNIPEVFRGVDTSYTLMDSTRSIGSVARPLFDSAEDFDRYFDTDEARAVFAEMFPPKAVDNYAKAARDAKGFEVYDTYDVGASYNEFKRLLKNVYYPSGSDPIKYIKSLEDLVNFVQTRAANTPRFMAAAAPEQVAYFTKLYRTLDDINQGLIQPINGVRQRSFDVLTPSTAPARALEFDEADEFSDEAAEAADSALSGVDDSAELNLDDRRAGKRDFSYTSLNDAEPEDLYSDYTTTYENYAKETFADLALRVNDQDTLDYISEPLKPYMELTVGKGYGNVALGSETLAGRLSMKDSSARAVLERYYREVLPLVEELVSKGGNPYSDWIPKGFSKEKMSKLVGYLNRTSSKYFPDTPDTDSKLFKYILDHTKLPNPDKFIPKRPDLSDYLDDIEGVEELPIWLTKDIYTPEEIISLSKPLGNYTPHLMRSAVQANRFGQAGEYAFEEYSKIVNELSNNLPNLGIKNVDEIRSILEKYRTSKPLSALEFRKLQAYSIAYANTIRQLPYHIVSRDVAAYSQSNGMPAIWWHLKNMPRGKEFNRLRRLAAEESTALFNKTGAYYNDALPYILRRNRVRNVTEFPYTEANEQFVREVFVNKLPYKERSAWRPSKTNGLFYFDVKFGEIPEAIRIGEQYDVYPGDFQLKYRTGLTLNELKDYNSRNKYGVYTDAIDYTKLVGRGADSLIRDIAKQQMLMEKFELPEMTFKSASEAFDEYCARHVVTQSSAKEAADAVQSVVVQKPVEEVVQEAFNPPSLAAQQVESVAEEVAPNVTHHLQSGGSPETAKAFYGEEEWRLSEQVQKAQAVPARNASGDSATLRTSRNVEIANRATRIESAGTPKKFKRFHILTNAVKGDILKGTDFWNSFRKTSEFVVAYPKHSPMIEATRNAMQKNSDLINAALQNNDTEVVVFNLMNGNVGVAIRWKDTTSTKSKLINRVEKNLKTLEKTAYSDIVFEAPRTLTASERAFLNRPEMRDYAKLLADTQELAAEQAKYLGFKFDVDPTYSKHVMRRDPETAHWLNMDLYGGDLKVGRDAYLDDISYRISGLDAYRTKDIGTFGTRNLDRRIRGNYWQLENKSHPLFYYNPTNVVKGTLSEGMFANNQYQTFVDLCINDTFKIREWFETPEELEKVLYASQGNLRNLELVSYRLDANGKLVGLTKYDKLSKKGLKQALDNPNTILVPTSAITHIDKLLRKDVRMKNKFWAFVNKHFTIPFKFGLLTNPGFLLGNVGDAVLKTSTTMSEKYGTAFTEEAANVAECAKQVLHLKNSYYEAFDSFIKAVDDYGIKLPPSAKVPDIVAMSPKYKQTFHDYLNGNLKAKVKVATEHGTEFVDEDVICDVAPKIINEARVHMMLQDIQMSSSKLREYEDLAGLTHESKFDVPSSVVDRITHGSGKYDPKKPSTWGVYVNNPVMRGITGASETWEELIRSASILDDLKHKRYTIDQMAEFSTSARRPVNESTRQFAFDIENAKNTMYNAQFDYEQLSDTLDGIGTVVPFPIFFLKNFVYWMELFEKNPDWVDNAIDVQEGLWSGKDVENDEFAKEAKGRGAIPVGGDSLPKWFRGIYKPAPLQSMFGAFSLLNDPLGDFGYRLHGVPNAAIAAVNRIQPNELTTSLRDPEETKYRPYSTDMYERNVKLTDRNYNPIEAAVHSMNPFERQTNTFLRTPAKIAAGDAQLSDFLPSVFQPDFSKK